MTAHSKNVFIHVLAFMVVCVWGSTFVFTKLLLQNGLSPAQIFTLRFAIAYILLTLTMMVMGKTRRWFADTWRDELMMVALGITGGSLYFLAENEALNYTTTTNTSLIVCSCPLAASFLIGLFYRSERMRDIQIVGSLLAVVGVAVVVLNGHFVLHLSPKGDALALTANLCWAFYSLLLIPANRRYDSFFITRKVFFYGLLTMVPYFLIHPEWPDWGVLLQPRIIFNLLFLGSVASMLCFLLWTWIMDRLGAMVATNYVYVNPITTVVFAWWILSEPITPFFVVGSLLILCGMYLADKRR